MISGSMQDALQYENTSRSKFSNQDGLSFLLDQAVAVVDNHVPVETKSCQEHHFAPETRPTQLRDHLALSLGEIPVAPRTERCDPS